MKVTKFMAKDKKETMAQRREACLNKVQHDIDEHTEKGMDYY
jgi:hypothetical protein